MTQTSTRSILFRPPFSILEPGVISNHWSYWPFRVRGNGNYRSQRTFSVNCSVNVANSRWLTTVSRGMYLLKRRHFLHSLPSCNPQYRYVSYCLPYFCAWPFQKINPFGFQSRKKWSFYCMFLDLLETASKPHIISSKAKHSLRV